MDLTVSMVVQKGQKCLTSAQAWLGIAGHQFSFSLNLHHDLIGPGVTTSCLFKPTPAAKCDPGCRNGGVCMEPNKCLCKSGYSGDQCEQSERGMPNDQEKDGLLDHIIDMTSYLLDLTSYIV